MGQAGQWPLSASGTSTASTSLSKRHETHAEDAESTEVHKRIVEIGGKFEFVYIFELFEIGGKFKFVYSFFQSCWKN